MKTIAFPGTKSYMSPELITGKENIDWGKSDVFSLGLTILEAITVKKFINLEKELESITKENLSKLEIEFKEIIIKNVKSEFFRKILPKMLEFDPKERISMSELRKMIGLSKISFLKSLFFILNI